MLTRRNESMSVTAVLGAVVALLMVFGSAAGAQDTDPHEPEEDSDQPEAHDAPAGEKRSREEALRRDAEQLAADRGWSEGRARARLERQERFDRLARALAAEHPDSYGGGWMGEGPDARPVVRFEGEVPEEARERARQHGLSVEFEPGAGNSLRELAARTDRVHEDLLERDYPEVVTAYSVREERIYAMATRPRDSGKSDEERRRELSEESQSSDVEIEFVDRPVAGLDHSYGGLRIFDDSDNDGALDWDEGWCTTGFAVVEWDGYPEGVSTAGHCTSMDQLQEENGNTYDTYWQGQHRGSWGDVEWHTTPHFEPAEFYSNFGYRRDVANVEPVSDIQEGDYYCKFGRNTGYTCDYVYNRSVSVTFDGITHRRLVAMRDRKAGGGDSGGPWFIVYEAAGSHTGWVWLDGSRRDVWSKAAYFDEALGVFVQTK